LVNTPQGFTVSRRRVRFITRQTMDMNRHPMGNFPKTFTSRDLIPSTQVPRPQINPTENPPPSCRATWRPVLAGLIALLVSLAIPIHCWDNQDKP
jgi:hypothetical protein